MWEVEAKTLGMKTTVCILCLAAIYTDEQGGIIFNLDFINDVLINKIVSYGIHFTVLKLSTHVFHKTYFVKL
jgi:hypothetical protein